MRKGIESAAAITIYAIFTVISCTLVGYFKFHENLSGINLIGLIIGILSLILISI